MKEYLGLGIALVALIGVAFLASKPAPQPIGAAAGPDVSFRTFFHDDMVVGGNTLATTSQGSVTYTAAQEMNNKLITHTASGALTATLAASTTFSGYLPNAGDTHVTCIDAVTTKITLAAGTGIKLSSASTTNDISPGKIGCFTLVRKANTDIDALLIAD